MALLEQTMVRDQEELVVIRAEARAAATRAERHTRIPEMQASARGGIVGSQDELRRGGSCARRTRPRAWLTRDPPVHRR